MTRCILISPNVKLRQALIQGLQSTPDVALMRTLDHHPQTFEAGRLLESLRPEIVLIDASDLQALAETARRWEQMAPEITQIGVDWDTTSSALLEAMHCGVRDFVSAPFTAERLTEVFERNRSLCAERQAGLGVANRVYSFIPAKGGVGCSTVATNTAVSLAARFPGKALLMDFDFISGVIGFSLNGRCKHSSWDALIGPAGIEDSLWRNLVIRHGALDVLPTPPVHLGSPEPIQEARHAIRYARGKYRATVVDLADQADAVAYDTLRHSHMIFLVTTPEVPALRLAHERLKQLQAEDLDDRVELIVNRAGTVGREPIEDLLGRAVYCEFPNDYRAATAAMQTGMPIGALGRSFDRFAATILGEQSGGESQADHAFSGLLSSVSNRVAGRLAKS